jgi:hypothetical protein
LSSCASADTLPDGSADWIWREHAITYLLRERRDGHLFVAGCKTNQGRFYPMFDHIVLLSAPVEPLVRATATAEIDATAPIEQVEQVADQLEELITRSKTP